MTRNMNTDKQAVHDFWNAASCGETLYLHGNETQAYAEQAAERYQLEPYIVDFAGFAAARDRDVLEIGVGLGADHQRFAEGGARLAGVDLTERAVAHTRQRLAAFGLSSNLHTADAENLPFESSSFDIVYSWGVLHHSPNTPKAIDEVWRVLRPGGTARIMIYHKHSMVGYMLWIRYALLVGRPWRTLAEIYSSHLESPGTKAYTPEQARAMLARFTQVKVQTLLTHGDLLTSQAGQRHRGPLLTIAKALWPRWLIRTLLSRHGLFLLAKATK
jgi:ubiquinone/menaquinone biosynthesis C-methylase UbiE